MKFHSKLIQILVFIAACFPLLGSCAEPDQYEGQLVEDIEIIIEGSCADRYPAAAAVQSRMKVRRGDFFSQTDFDKDLKELANEYDRVEPTVDIIDGMLFIKMHIWPKPLIRSIHWTGNCVIPAKRLQKELGVCLFSVFDRDCFAKCFHKLKAYYVKKGFFEAELDYKVETDCQTNEVDIEIIICEGRAGRIDNIVFCNFASCETEEILELMCTKKFNVFFSWMSNEGTYNEDMVYHDQLVIVDYLQNRGFADAKVKIDVCDSTRKRKIILKITADRGPRYHFNCVTFEGNKLFCDDDIRAQLLIGDGTPFSPKGVHESIRKIVNLYGKYGYIDATVDFEPTLLDDQCAYNLHLKIEEGQQYHVGMIKIFGNCATKNSVILHETLLVPGEIFNLCKLQKTEEKLRNIGYFKCVNVYAVKSEGADCLGDSYRDVHIEVEETNTGQFGLFAGFSSSENLFGGLNITERNFNWRGLDRVWDEGYCALRGGGEYAHITASVGTKSRRYGLSWMRPYFMDTRWTFGFDIERNSNRYISDHYDIESGSFTLKSYYDVNSFVKVGWHYRLKNSAIHIDQDGYEKDYEKQMIAWEEGDRKGAKPRHRHPDNKLIEQAKRSGIVSATGWSLMYDSTDHPTEPRRGFKSRLMCEIAGLGGPFKFYSAGYLNTWFYPVDKRTILKVRADARFIKPFGSDDVDPLPLDERLFLGGDSTVRGYRAYRIGPVFDHDKEEPTGGCTMVLFSTEISQKWHKRIESFGFFDAGSISKTAFEVKKIYMSVGCGLRLNILPNMPPLTIGYGVPLNPDNRSQVKKFFIQVGGVF